MKQFSLGNYSLDDFADFLNGKNCPYFDDIKGNELIITGTHILTKTINLNFPITITGKDTVIKGENSDIFAFSVLSSDTTVQGLCIEGFKYGVEVDALGKCVENVRLQDITVTHALNGFEVGSSLSNSILRNIYIDSCTSISIDAQWEEYEYADLSLGFILCCARHKG